MMPGSLFSHSFFSDIPYLDKAVHCFLFLVFALLFYNSISPAGIHGMKRQHAVMLTLIISLLYGIILEFLQNYVPGRSFEFTDIIADGTGAGLGIIIWIVKDNISFLVKK
jgi:VanZ family protein